MYTQQQAVEFGKASAMMALDAWGDYGSLENSIASHRENVRDTLNDERSSQWEADAWQSFDAYVSAHAAATVSVASVEASDSDAKTLFTSQYEEHMAHSAPCVSRFDGFDRGDTDEAYEEELQARNEAWDARSITHLHRHTTQPAL